MLACERQHDIQLHCVARVICSPPRTDLSNARYDNHMSCLILQFCEFETRSGSSALIFWLIFIFSGLELTFRIWL